MKINKIKKVIIKRLNNKNKISKKSFSFKQILTIAGILVYLSGFPYFYVFFQNFNILPSLYLTVEDASLLLWNKSALYLIGFLTCSPLLGFVWQSMVRSKRTNGNIAYRNLIISIFLGTIFMSILNFQYPESIMKNLLITFMIVSVTLLISFVDKKYIVIGYGFSFLLLTVHLANLDAKNAWNNKSTFDLVLLDDTKCILQDSKKSFYLTSTVNYIVIYDNVKESVVPIPKSQVKLISFPFDGKNRF